MKQKKLNKLKNAKVTIDPSLSKYVDMPIFQKRVDRANELLKSSNIEEFLKSLPPR